LFLGAKEEPDAMRSRRAAGFTLIELLVVVAILGIIMALAAFNFRNAIERSRQRRSMGDMRALSTAIESYAIDFERYPPASAFVLPVGLDLPAGNLVATRPYLQPTYLRAVPLADGWNSWFGYGTTAVRTDYVLRSAGRGGAAQTAPLYGPTTDLSDDIILVNGQFAQWPEGSQR
jgi:general secretion pathway protein G